MLDNLMNKYRDIQAKRANGEGGFTLIELLVVVVIIGILIAIAIPLYLNYQEGAHDKSAASDVRGAVSAVSQCAADNTGNVAPTTSAGGTNGTDLTFSCGSTGNTSTQTATVTDGNTLTYTATGNDYVITGTANDNGSGKVYTYRSTTGKTTSTNG